MLNLGGSHAPLKFSLYADESKPDKSCPWLIIGILVLADAVKAEALMRLRAAREEFGYQREIHFQRITNLSTRRCGEKTAVALDWVRCVIGDRRRTWNLHVRAISPQRLNYSRFGSVPDDNIYTRFFRSTVSYAIKASIKAEPFSISRVFHDDSHLSNHQYFPWNAIRRLGWDDGVTFGTSEIEFVSSDHNRPAHPFPEAAEFIQLVDVWIGVFRQVLTSASSNVGKLEVANVAGDFLRTLNDPDHRCYSGTQIACSYEHRGRCSLGYFPHATLGKEEMAGLAADMKSHFYLGEKLLLFDDPAQMRMF
ncbi:hypothetical protein EPN44_10915 [bacterium]|nr:MAG: hypothetical protein EPN44_10915 [bacterium]